MPSDAYETEQITRQWLKWIQPAYIALRRRFITSKHTRKRTTHFEIGKASLLRKGDDVTESLEPV